MVDEEVMQSQANEIARLRAHAARLEGEVERLKIERDEAKDLADGFQSEAADLRGEVEEERSRRGRAEVNMDAALRRLAAAEKTLEAGRVMTPAMLDSVSDGDLRILYAWAAARGAEAETAKFARNAAESRAARLEEERDEAQARFLKVQFWEDKIDKLTAERDDLLGAIKEVLAWARSGDYRRIPHSLEVTMARLAAEAVGGGCWRCGNAEQPGSLILAGRGGMLVPCPYCRPGKAVEWMADAAPRRESK